MARVLVVDDDASLSATIKEWLTFKQHDVRICDNAQEAFDTLKEQMFEVMILDWELPDGDGVSICKWLRSTGRSIPVLMLTAKAKLEEKVAGFDAGADDYLTKPFHMKELQVRLEALLRRAPQQQGPELLLYKNLKVDPTSRRIWKGDQEVVLQRLEFNVLEFLLRHPNQVFSAEALLSQLWSHESEASPDTVRTCIKKLRKKIDGDADESVIKNVHGVGYRIDG